MTKYQHSNGRTRLRATTLCGPWHNPPAEANKPAAPPRPGAGGFMPEQPSPVKMSFDQEAAAVLLARVAVERTGSEDIADVLRWVDRSLIRLGAKFADYVPDDPNSFRLSPEFSLFPQVHPEPLFLQPKTTEAKANPLFLFSSYSIFDGPSSSSSSTPAPTRRRTTGTSSTGKAPRTRSS